MSSPFDEFRKNKEYEAINQKDKELHQLHNADKYDDIVTSTLMEFSDLCFPILNRTYNEKYDVIRTGSSRQTWKLTQSLDITSRGHYSKIICPYIIAVTLQFDAKNEPICFEVSENKQIVNRINSSNTTRESLEKVLLSFCK